MKTRVKWLLPILAIFILLIWYYCPHSIKKRAFSFKDKKDFITVVRKAKLGRVVSEEVFDKNGKLFMKRFFTKVKIPLYSARFTSTYKADVTYYYKPSDQNTWVKAVLFVDNKWEVTIEDIEPDGRPDKISWHEYSKPR